MNTMRTTSLDPLSSAKNDRRETTSIEPSVENRRPFFQHASLRLAFCAGCLALLAPPAQAAVTYFNGFDGSVGAIKKQYECRTGQYVLVTSPKKYGTGSFKTYQSANQTCAEPDGDQKHRTEFAWGSTFAHTIFENQWGWFGFAVYFPSDFPLSDNGGAYIMQTYGGGFGPRLLVNQAAGKIRLQVDRPGPTVIWTSGTIARGQWHTFVFKTYLSRGSAGRISMWHNGTLVVNNNAGQNYSGTQGGCFIKTGLYWGPENRNNNYTLHWDELRIGDANSSYNEVKPR